MCVKVQITACTLCACVICRQQIEDCEREMNRLKELVKKKEDTEKKYQGLWTTTTVH